MLMTCEYGMTSKSKQILKLEVNNKTNPIPVNNDDVLSNKLPLQHASCLTHRAGFLSLSASMSS